MAVHGHTPHVEEHADSWHHHSSAEGIPQHEHGAIASPGTLLRSFIAICASVGIVVGGLVMYYTYYSTGYKAKRFETNNLTSEGRVRKLDWERMLREPAPVGEKSYSIPINIAMDKVVEKYAAGSKPATKTESQPAPK